MPFDRLILFPITLKSFLVYYLRREKKRSASIIYNTQMIRVERSLEQIKLNFDFCFVSFRLHDDYVRYLRLECGVHCQCHSIEFTFLHTFDSIDTLDSTVSNIMRSLWVHNDLVCFLLCNCCEVQQVLLFAHRQWQGKQS